MQKKDQVFLYIKDEIEKISSAEEKEILDEAKAIEQEAYNQLRGEAEIDAKHQLDKELAEKVIIAYEPIWAIGTGKTATKEQANETIAAIRKVVAGMFGQEVADKIRIQYGGSVKPATIKDQMAMSDIDGALVGGASLVADDFSKIVNY